MNSKNINIETKKIQELFLNLVEIDSPAGHEKIVSDFIIKELKKIKIVTEQDAYGNLIAKIPGEGAGVMLCSHLDTVEPGRKIKAQIKGDLITSVGDTILGADDKAGITEILLTVEYLIKNKISHRPIEIIFTREEEIGSIGAKNLDYKKIKAKEGLILDRGGKAEAIVIAAPFVTDITFNIQGKATHAGYPEQGIDAIKIAAEAITKIKLGRIDEETTCNIGIIRGGEIRNGVAEHVLLRAEVRSHVKSKMIKQVKTMEGVFKTTVKNHQAKIKIKKIYECTGYKYSLNDPLVKKLGLLWQSLGFNPFFEKAGGVSDANEFVKKGIKAVTIGYGGKNPHSTNESIRISDMQKIIKFLIIFLTTK